MSHSTASRLTALFTSPQRSLTRYAGVAMVAAAIDWLTKVVAVQSLGVGGEAPREPWRFLDSPANASAR